MDPINFIDQLIQALTDKYGKPEESKKKIGNKNSILLKWNQNEKLIQFYCSYTTELNSLNNQPFYFGTDTLTVSYLCSDILFDVERKLEQDKKEKDSLARARIKRSIESI